LTLGKDPNRITLDYINKCDGPSIFIWYYKNIRDRISQAQVDHELADPIRPRIYIEWAIAQRIKFPSELEQAAPEHDNSADDYLWLYKSALEEKQRLAAKLGDLEWQLKAKPGPPAAELSTPPTEVRYRRRDLVKKAIEELWGDDVTGVPLKTRLRMVNGWLVKRDLSPVKDSTIARAVAELRQNRR
jgi:hypothetical protein